MRQGTLVDATIIAAPASTKNKDHALDPEMHQAKKGNQWHFGMKAHIGVDERAEITEARQAGDIRKDMKWHVATKRGLIKAMPEGHLKAPTVLVSRREAQIRALVEHPFHVIKNPFGYTKVSYRGLRKNGVRLYAQFALANLLLAKRALLDEAHRGIGTFWMRKRHQVTMNFALNRVRRLQM